MCTLQDRVIAHRLENVCHCIEKGEWPPQHKYPLLNLPDSRSSTPVAGTPTPMGTPKPGTPLAHDYTVMPNAEGLVSGLTRGRRVMGWMLGDYEEGGSDDSKDFKVHLSEVWVHV